MLEVLACEINEWIWYQRKSKTCILTSSWIITWQRTIKVGNQWKMAIVIRTATINQKNWELLEIHIGKMKLFWVWIALGSTSRVVVLRRSRQVLKQGNSRIWTTRPHRTLICCKMIVPGYRTKSQRLWISICLIPLVQALSTRSFLALWPTTWMLPTKRLKILPCQRCTSAKRKPKTRTTTSQVVTLRRTTAERK